MQLQAKELVKEFGNDASRCVAVNGISLELEKGDCLAVCGPSGCGKSTLLTLLAALQPPSRGTVIIDEIDVYEDLDPEGQAALRAQYIGFVFQSFHLVPYLSALENVMLPLAPQAIRPSVKKEAAREALDRVRLGSKAGNLPRALSGGEMQRVAIARAIVNTPLILFADEPTGNLDTTTRDEILDLFQDLNREGQTLVMVTHDPDTISRASRVLRMRDGRTV